MRVMIETERLILRNLRLGDEAAVYAWAGDPDVARYMIYPLYRSEADGIEWLRERKPENSSEAAGLCIIRKMMSGIWAIISERICGETGTW